MWHQFSWAASLQQTGWPPINSTLVHTALFPAGIAAWHRDTQLLLCTSGNTLSLFSPAHVPGCTTRNFSNELLSENQVSVVTLADFQANNHPVAYVRNGCELEISMFRSWARGVRLQHPISSVHAGYNTDWVEGQP